MGIDFTKIWSQIENNRPEKMNDSEYKNYILAFMFYRYLSEHQEEYLVTNNVIDVPKGTTPNEVYNNEANNDDLADYLNDISSTLGYAIEPDDTWISIVNKIRSSTLKPSDFQKIFDNFEKNTLLNDEATAYFSGIFADVNIGDSRLGSDTNEHTRTLAKFVKTIDEMSFKDEEGNSIIQNIFEKMIEQFANSAGKTGGEFYTPSSVSTLLSKLVTDGLSISDNTFTGYDMSSGSGSTLLALKDEVPGGERPGAVKLYGSEIEMSTYNLSRMNLLLGGISYKNVALNNADTLGEDWPDGPDKIGNNHPRIFDAVVSDIKFAQKWGSTESRLKDPRFIGYLNAEPKGVADYAFVLHGLYHLSNDGTMAVILPQGVLFRGGIVGEPNARTEAFIRKNLIESASGNKIDAIIGLPENIMYAAKGKKSVAVLIMILKKERKTNDVLFIDASNQYEQGKNRNYLSKEIIARIVDTYHNRIDVDKYAHLASIDEIRENDYNLNIPRYVETSEEEKPVDLDKVEQLLDRDDAEIMALKTEIDKTLVLLGVKKL